MVEFWYGVGSVLELMPQGEIFHERDPEEALLADLEKVNRDFCIAFERLAAEYGETPIMPAGRKQDPFPPPEVLERYKQVMPDFPERWLTRMEDEARQRHEMEAKEQELQFAERKRGQIFGFAIGLVAIIAGSVTASLGAEWAGLGIGGGGVIGLVSVFVLGKRGK